MRLLSFVVTGLVSGSLCWWLFPLIPEQLLFLPYVGCVYPGVVLAISLLVLGKVLGVVPSGKGIQAAGILVVSAVLARQLVFEAFHVQGIIFEYPPYHRVLDLYQQAPFGEMLLQGFSGWFQFFWLPSPIAGAIQVFILALGVTFTWKVSVSRTLVVMRAALYGALFALLPVLILNFVPDDLVNAIFSRDQSPHVFLSWLLGNMVFIITPLLWHILVLVALYMAVGPMVSPVASPYNAAGGREAKISNDYPRASFVPSPDKSFDEVKRKSLDDSHNANLSRNRLSTPAATAVLKARSRIAKGVAWLLLVGGLLFVGWATSHSYTTVTNVVTSTVASQQMLVEEHVSSHPLHTLWKELKGCGGDLQTMSDLMVAMTRERGVGEEVLACEAAVLDRLDGEHKGWQEELANAAETLSFSLKNELLVRYHVPPDNAIDAFLAVLTMCDATFNPEGLREEILAGEPMSQYQVRRWDCIKDEMQGYLQKSFEETGKSAPVSIFRDLLEFEGLWGLGGSRSDYYYLNPHAAWPESWEYWDDYRQMEDDGYTSGSPPSGSFLKTLNLAWESGDLIRPVDKADELGPYAHRDMQLITPIVVGGQTQGLILSEIPYYEMDDFSAVVWQSYYRKVTVTVVFLALFFLVFQYRKLGTIPNGMDFMWWRPRLWHPSLLRLYLSSDYRHQHLLNSAVLMILPVPLFYIGEPLMALLGMSFPLLFGLIALPRVVTDYRLFARGIPVVCEEVDTTVKMVASASYAITTYEASYQGKLYHISATPKKGMKGPLVALIDPDRGDRGVLLNAFCEE